MLCFNAARGFVGGAAATSVLKKYHRVRVSMPHAALWVVQHPIKIIAVLVFMGFNAARGFVGGAAMRLG